jgi:oxygen-independent coproporphyrinogen III oxidase
MKPETIEKYCAPVPRYTSYPTAPNFSSRIGELHYVAWLATLSDGAELSLYVHIPFCHSLCWYCGCSTKATLRYAPVASYLHALITEVANVAALVPPGHRVTHVHWGGGSPNILSPSDIQMLAAELRSRFNIGTTAEFAVEVDPRYVDGAGVDAMREAGVTRVSIGVQDFDAQVQAAIGRDQSFAATKSAIDAFRSKGVRSINIDLMYGLPHQTPTSVDRTVEQVLDLEPDRIAVFGYAHLPARMKHQRLISERALPGAVERHAQAARIARRLAAQGYVRIGLDHFAKPTDALAICRVGRNFQGYTTDQADALLGLGTSAIGRLPQGYVQNAAAVGDYTRRIRDCGLATSKGFALGAEDRVRAYVIERLMCDMTFAASDIEGRFGAAADAVVKDAKALVEADEDAMLEGTADGFVVTERGRPFIRSICARFDAYLGQTGARYSMGV